MKKCQTILTAERLRETEEEAYAAYCAAKAELHTFNPVPRKPMEQTL